ncbi:hypothetical protein K523DRAFT_418739 [Schizophyllum commune Tattone D]|nr:hypothetical protein K523DRAFT_418739 [Schizophyllum commune Tattone D]
MPPTRSGRQSTRLSRIAPEVIDISDEDDVRQPRPVRRRQSRSRKPIFIDLTELSDDDDGDVRRVSRHTLLHGKKYDDDDIDDGVPFPEIAFQLPPPPTYEQVLAEVEPGMRALGAPDWAVDMAADLMFSVEYELDYQTLLQLDEVVETSHTNVTHFMGTVNRARGNGEKTRYELCTFKNGMYLEFGIKLSKADVYEPPEWFAEVTSAITDSMVNLYDDTSSQLDETTLCVMHALTMVAKLTNVLARRVGLTSGYDIVPFVDGSWPPNELPPLVSDDAIDTLGERERRLYLEGYGVRDWDEETWRPLLFEAIGAPIDLPLPDESGPIEV